MADQEQDQVDRAKRRALSAAALERRLVTSPPRSTWATSDPDVESALTEQDADERYQRQFRAAMMASLVDTRASASSNVMPLDFDNMSVSDEDDVHGRSHSKKPRLERDTLRRSRSPAPRGMHRLEGIAAAGKKKFLDIEAAKKAKKQELLPGIFVPCGDNGVKRKKKFPDDTLAMLFKIAIKIVQHPTDEKYRRVKITNAKFAATVWQFAPAKALLKMTGWVEDGAEHVKLPMTVPSAEEFLSLILTHPFVGEAEKKSIATQKTEEERQKNLAVLKLQRKEEEERRKLVTLRIQNDRNRQIKTKFMDLVKTGGCQSAFVDLLSQSPDLITALDGGRPSLLIAAGFGNIEAVKALVSQNAEVDSMSLGGDTALHAAASEGHLTTIDLLLGLQASLEIQDRSQSTPLSLAACHGHDKAVQLLLLNGAQHETKDVCGRTAFFRAVLCGSVQTVDILLQTCADTNIESRDIEGRTPLIAAAAEGHNSVVEQLLRHGAHVQATDSKNRSALSVAAGNNHATTVTTLLEAGSDVDAVDVHGASAAWHACSKNSGAALAVLVEYQCNLLLNDIRFNQSPIELAFENLSFSCIEVLRTVDGIDLPDLPNEMLGYHNDNHTRDGGVVVAKRGDAFVDSSLEALQQIVDDRTQIFPRELIARFEGEEAYGEGPTRQWVVQLGRELLRHCDPAIDTATSFSATIAPSEHAQKETFRFSLYGSEGDEAGTRATIKLSRHRRYRFYFKSQEYNEYGVRLMTNITSLRDASDRVIIDVNTSNAAVAVVTVQATAQTPSHLFFHASAKDSCQFVPTRIEIVNKHFCVQHGLCLSRERCQLVYCSDLFHCEEGVPHHFISLSPVSDPANNVEAQKLLRGLGRSLAIILVTKSPLGVTLSPSFCKVLCGEADNLNWKDLVAILPTTQFNLLSQCLDTTTDVETRASLIDLWCDCTGYSTFVTKSVAQLRHEDALANETIEPEREPSRVVSSVCPLGVEKKLTVETMEEYADWLASKRLYNNISEHIKHLKLGLRDVHGAVNAIKKLDGWKGVQRSIMGSLKIDVDEWKQMVQVGTHDGRERSDSDASLTLELFWKAVKSLEVEEQRKLLFFWTAEAPPAGGMRHLERKMSLTLQAANKQPSAATCFYALRIPLCTTSLKMKTVVGTCIAHWNSWGRE